MNKTNTPTLSRLAPSDAASLNLTPLIDVVLLLLIFFMLTSPMVLRSALPEITPPETTAPRAVTNAGEQIEIDAADRISLNGAPVSLAELGARLPELRARSGRVMVLADAAASLGVTIRVMDVCREHEVAVDIYATPIE